MQYTHEQIKVMLHGAYKKLKSYYFYDKTLLFIKKKLAEFESDDLYFEQAFCDMADAIAQNDSEYFDVLIQQLDYQVFPKSFISTKEPTTAIVGAIDHSKNISKVNFFIDVPVELLIIDCLWTLFLAKIGNDKYGSQACSYAGKFKSSIFFFGNDDLFSGIDWQSNRCFEPYYENYARWQKDAFSKLREGLSKNNQLMFSLDMKSFYYSVRFEFDSLNPLLSNDPRLEDIAFISNILKRLYLAYTKLIAQYKLGIDIKNDATIFPIGLLSPILLRELYLFKFDQTIKNRLNPTHYGRYVDDMLIVIPTEEDASSITQEYICRFLKGKGLIKKKGSLKSDDYVFVDFDSIAIQQSKINCFFFEENASNILIEVAERQLRNNSSEANLLPEFDEIKKHFNDIAYFFNSIGGSTKIRDIGILQSNNYAASKSITLMKQLLKNTYVTKQDRVQIEEYLNELLEFYSGSSAFEYMGSWTSIFELLLQLKVLSGDVKKRDPFAKRFYHNIVNYIDHTLSFDFLNEKEIYAKKKRAILRKLKQNLKDRLGIAISTAMALDYRWNTSTSSVNHNIELAKKFRKSNIFNHNLISFPLLNYLPFDQISTCSFIEIQKDPWDSPSSFMLDKKRLNFTPRFIHLDELFIYYFMKSTQNGKKEFDSRSNLEAIWERYAKLNNVERFAPDGVATQDHVELQESGVDLINIYIPNGTPAKYYVGLANTTVTEEDALQSLIHPEHKMTIKDKEQLFRMANTAVKEGANFITFPEFFVPIVWLKDLTRFAQKNDVTIIAGLRYIRNTNRAFNCTTIIQPCNNNGFQNAVAIFREKNFYAPEEKECLYKLGYHISDPVRPLYYVVNANGIRYSTILCFEFTDILSRSSLKGKVDALFVPQLNRDTNYFSSIVESTSRDLHCFIVQANTSKYGDSRITGPYDTIHKNIVQIKGGINDVVIIGELKFDEVKRARKEYEIGRKKTLIHCFACKKVKKATYPDFFKPCRDCPHRTHKQSTKDVPAHF